MDISIIVAMGENRVIGKANELPWRLSADLKRFKELTRGHAVIMGRKTFESIFARLKKPLPERTNIVVTHQKDFPAPEGCIVVSSLEQAIGVARSKNETEAFIIGGGQIYALALPVATKLYITKVGTTPEGDAVFPVFDESEWNLVSSEAHPQDEANNHAYAFLTYERKK